MDVFFAGDSWTKEKRQAVLQELRSELGRRRLEVCHRTILPPNAAENELSLVAIGADEVRIIPARLSGESAWQGGRTMQLASLPEDARSLAIALAADEVLRGRPASVEASTATSVPKDTATEPTREANPTRIDAAIGVTGRAAMAAGGGERSLPLGPGIALRFSATRATWGGSLGAAFLTSTEWSFQGDRFRELRLPFDFSAKKIVPAGPFEAAFEAGLVVSFLKLEYVGNGQVRELLEAGGRLGVSLAWGRKLVPFIGACLELMPQAHDISLTPQGYLGHTAQLWAGFTVGLEARF